MGVVLTSLLQYLCIGFSESIFKNRILLYNYIYVFVGLGQSLPIYIVSPSVTSNTLDHITTAAQWAKPKTGIKKRPGFTFKLSPV